MAARLAGTRAGVDSLSQRAARVSPDRRLAQQRQRVDDLNRRAGLAMSGHLRSARERLNGLRLHLSGLDPAAVLARGYAIVSRPDGAVVRSAVQVAIGDALTVRVADGEFGVTVG